MNEIIKVLSYTREHRRKVYYAIILATLSVFISIAPYYLVHVLIREFMTGSAVSVSVIAMLSGAVLFCLIGKSVLYFSAMKYSHQAAFDTLYGMRNSLADKMARLPMGDITNQGSGSFKQIFVDLIEEMELIIAHIIPEGISNTLVPLTVIVFLFFIDWRMALLTLAMIPIVMLVFFLMMRGRITKMDRYLKATQNMSENIVEFIGGMEVIKIFNQTESSFARYATSVREYKNFILDWSRDAWPYLAAFYVLLPCTIIFLVPCGGLFMMAGSLDIAGYILCILLALSLGTPLLRLTEFGNTFHMIIMKSRIIDNILTREELPLVESNLSPARFDIGYNQVSFAYEDEKVLKEVSFTAAANTVTALVGKSGSGKTTIARLLLRFWDNREGEITIGGINIKELSFSTLMDSISYVSQDVHLFNIPVMDNIRMGKPDATDDEVITVAKIAQCHDFIMEMDQQYQTGIGTVGNKLSGGQKQRLSIARALLKDAPIIVLDEATAFTDPENEDLIQGALNGLLLGKTVLVIAHRLSTITEADNIILMDGGAIAAQGTHDDLLDRSPIYHKMWDAHMESMTWNISVKEEEND